MPNSVTADQGDTGDPDSLPPLTRNGYTRTERTEADIRAMRGLPEHDLAQAFRIAEAEPGYRGSEALVFFIREAHRAGNRRVMNELADVLIARCQLYFEHAIRGLDINARLDAQADVFEDLFRLLLAPDDRGDFLESAFLTYLKRETARARGRIRKRYHRAPLIADYVDDPDDEAKFVATHRHEAELDEAEQLRIREAVAILPDALRELVVLRYFSGWQIGDERNKTTDDQRETLAKKYDVTPRTIHNRLAKAYELMEKFWKDDQ